MEAENMSTSLRLNDANRRREAREARRAARTSEPSVTDECTARWLNCTPVRQTRRGYSYRTHRRWSDTSARPIKGDDGGGVIGWAWSPAGSSFWRARFVAAAQNDRWRRAGGGGRPPTVAAG